MTCPDGYIFKLLIAAALLVSAGAITNAQPIAIAAPQTVQDEERAPNVFLDDSLEAREAIEKAQELAARGDWSRAARTLDEVVATQGDKLILMEPGLYGSVRQQVRRIVQCWPVQGLDAYRVRYDAAANKALEDAEKRRDLADLLTGFDRYFCTSSGWVFGDTAAQMAIESGRFRLAERIYGVLAEQHPDRAKHADDLNAKRAVAAELAGKGEIARRFAAASGGTLQWMGRPQTINEVLSALERLNPPADTGAEAGKPLELLGSEKLAQLWRFDAFGDGSPSMVSLMEQHPYGYPRAGEYGNLLAMHPAHRNGVIYLQDAERVWAIRAESGQLLWHYEGPSDDALVHSTSDNTVTPWFGVTVDDRRVYASLGSNLVPYYGYEPADSQSSLVCLDADTGRLRWCRDGSRSQGEFAHVDFDGAPIVSHGVLFVIERRRRAFGFEDCALIRLDASTGALLTRTHLGGASTGGFGYRRPTMALAALNGDTVYVATNLGTVSAVSVDTGVVRWLRTYSRNSDEEEGRSSATNHPWRYNRVLVSGERVTALPTDVQRVLVLDAASGEIEDEIPISEIGGAESLYGIAGDCLYGVGRQAFAYDLAAGDVRWLADLPEGSRLFGRGILLADAILAPTTTSLAWFSFADGRTRSEPWDSTEDGGNLILAGDRLIVAGVTHLSVYANKRQVWQRLRALMAADPRDPAPALEMAEIAFRSGDVSDSAASLAEAVKRGGGFAGLTDEPIKRRIFEDCLSFAECLHNEEATDAMHIALQTRLFEMASQCPPDKASHIRYRLEFADFLIACGETGRAVELYQQIMADRSLRDEPHPVDDGNAFAAVGSFCRDRVEAIIEQSGRQVYAAFDAKAEALYADAKSAADLALLERIVAVYPNSLVAPRALMLRGDLLRAAGGYIAAARCYYQAAYGFQHSMSASQRAEALAQIPNCYEAAGRHDAALRWIGVAGRNGVAVHLAHTPRSLDPADLIEQEAFACSGPPDLPNLTPPLNEAYEHDCGGGAVLLKPHEQASCGSDWRRFYTYGDDTLSSFRATDGALAWTSACQTEPTLLASRRDRIVFATRHEVFALDSATGRRVWTEGEYPSGLDSVLADHEDFPEFSYQALRGDRVVIVDDRGHAVCRAVGDGTLVWSQQLDILPTGPLDFGAAVIAYPAIYRGRSVCCILDADSGVRRHRLALDEDAQINQVLVTDDDQVLVATSRSLFAFEAGGGDLNWRRSWSERLPGAGVYLGIDGIYVTTGGGRLEKLRLSDGRPIWHSSALSLRSDTTLKMTSYVGLLLVIGDGVLLGLDEADGRTVFEPVAPAGAAPDRTALTERFLVVLDTAGFDPQEPTAMYLFDLTAGGALPASGGTETLGRLSGIKAMVVCDDAVVIQEGDRIVGFTSMR